MAPALLAPQALDFGTLPVGAPARRHTVTLTLLALKNFTLGALSVTGAGAADFTLGGTCVVGQTFSQEGSSCTVTVDFSPGAPGRRSGELVIDGTPSPALAPVPLEGAGQVSATSIISAPGSSSTLYAAIDGVGVYQSDNSGATWSAATTQPTNRQVRALILNSGSPLFAGTAAGVFKAASGTTAFAACATQPANPAILSLTIDAAGKLYAGTEAGVFVSTDSCASWAALNSGLP